MQSLIRLNLVLLIALSAIIISCSSDSSLESAIPENQAIISGSVELPDGEDYAIVYLFESPDDSVITDSAGNFEIIINMSDRDALGASITNTANEKLIIVTPSGSHGYTTTVEVTKGERAVVTHVMLELTGSVSGQITLEGEVDHSGITVSLFGTNFSTTTGINGNFSINDIPEGTYMTLSAEKDDFISTFASDIIVISNQDILIDAMTLAIIECSTSSYYASTGLFPDNSTIPWEVVDTTVLQDSLKLNAGILNIESVDPAEYLIFKQASPSLSMPDDDLIIEARVRIISGESSDSARDIAAIVFTNKPNWGNKLYIGKDKVFILSEELTPGATALVDTDDSFHTYRIELSSISNEMRVYYDGNLLLSGMTFESTQSHGTIERIQWGDSSSATYGVSQWKYITHNAKVCVCQQSTPTPVGYYASSDLLPTNALPPWELYNTTTSNSSLTLLNNSLRIESGNMTEYLKIIQTDSMLDIPEILTIEASLIINSGERGHEARSIAGIKFATEPGWGNILAIDKDIVFLLANMTSPGESAIVDTDESYHTYRLEINKTSKLITVYYDGTELISGALLDSTQVNTPTTLIEWGDWSNSASGISSWKYFTHNAGLSSACIAP